MYVVFSDSIFQESVGMQSVVQSDEICYDCFGLIVSNLLPDDWGKIISDSEELPPMTCQITSDNSFPHRPDFTSVFPPDSPIRLAIGRALLFKLLLYFSKERGKNPYIYV